MNRKTTIIISITAIAIIILALLGITFGYYLTQVYGNESAKSIEITTGDAKVTFTDLSDTNEEISLSLGESFTKMFTVENTGRGSADYYVYLTEITNTFIRQEDVRYTLYRIDGDTEFPENFSGCVAKTDDTYNESCLIITEDGQYPNQPSVISPKETLPSTGDIYKYALVVTYINQPDINQDADKGKIVAGKVQIAGIDDLNSIIGEINVTNGTLAINYASGNYINLTTNILVEDADIKEEALRYPFSVTNTGDTHQKITIKLTDINIDDSLKTADFRWGLYNADTGNGLSFGIFKYSETSKEELIYTDTIIDAGDSEPNNYILRIWIHNNGTDKDTLDTTTQSDLLSKNFSANISVSGEAVEYTDESCFTYGEGYYTGIIGYDVETCGTDVVIPKTINGNTVTTITTETGASLYTFNGITSIIIPDTVTKIDGYEDEYSYVISSNQINHITIPESVTYVGTLASANQLSSVFIPDTVSAYKQEITNGSSIKSLVIPKGSIFADGHAVGYGFANMTSLTDVALMEGVTQIGPNTFNNNTALTSIEIPSSVTILASNAFSGCTNLTEIIIRGKSSLSEFENDDSIETGSLTSLDGIPETTQITFRPIE